MKNLIDLKQLREDQLSGWAIASTSGLMLAMSGTLRDLIEAVSGSSGSAGTGSVYSYRSPLSLGVDTITVLYGASYTGLKPVGQLGNSGVADPILLCMMTVNSSTGVVFSLSDRTPSSNYYLNLMVPV